MLSRGDKKPAGGGNVPAADDLSRDDRGTGKQSVVGAGLRVVGEIESTGSVRIEGHVQGNVRARTLMVGDAGRVDGNLDAEIAQINGTVNGKLQAATVILGATARFKGDIVQQSLVIEPGAKFEGRVRSMDAKKKAAGKPPGRRPSPGLMRPRRNRRRGESIRRRAAAGPVRHARRREPARRCLNPRCLRIG
jgi:cytoskeletal protein CcmA (bactofilin family)